MRYVGLSRIRRNPTVAAQMIAAVRSGIAAHRRSLDVVWWPELGPLNVAEAQAVRLIVAGLVTYDCSQFVRYSE